MSGLFDRVWYAICIVCNCGFSISKYHSDDDGKIVGQKYLFCLCVTNCNVESMFRMIYSRIAENQRNYDLFGRERLQMAEEEVINFISIVRWIIAAEWIITSSESTARTLGLSMSLGVFLFICVLFFSLSLFRTPRWYTV